MKLATGKILIEIGVSLISAAIGIVLEIKRYRKEINKEVAKEMVTE